MLELTIFVYQEYAYYGNGWVKSSIMVRAYSDPVMCENCHSIDEAVNAIRVFAREMSDQYDLVRVVMGPPDNASFILKASLQQGSKEVLKTMPLEKADAHEFESKIGSWPL